MEGKIINVGIAGFGMSGKLFQAPFLNADARFKIKKVYERASDNAKEEYPYIETVRSFEALLGGDIDLVVISTPNPLHAPMAEQAIAAGKNVVVEKPVAATSAEARALCDLAKEKGVLFSVYQNRRLDGDFLTVKKLIEDGALGEVLDYNVRFDRFVKGASSKKWKAQGGKGVDVLYDLGVHLIDQAYALFGMPREVYADFRKQRAESGGIDNFNVTLYYENARAELSAGELVAMPGPHFVVNGRNGTFIKCGMDAQGDALAAGKRPPSDGWGRDEPAMYGTLARVTDGGIAEEKVPTIAGDYGRYYDNIYHALVDGAPLLVEPLDSVNVLKIMEAAMKSAESGRRETP